jgi:L-fucose mutarotase
MLKTKLLHPEILQALGSNGHGAQVLIADGNYPFSTGAPPGARRVYLNLAKDMLAVVDVLKVLAESVSVEKATVMLPADGEVPEIFREFTDVLGAGVPFTRLKRFEFYDEAKSDATCLVIATGESRRFANILLTIGVVK